MDIKASLTIIEGEDRGKTITITKPRTVVGRSRGDLLLNDKKVSSEHLCLIVEGGKLYVEDLASTNGTHVNDELVEEKVELKNLDEITIGFSRCRISIVDNLEKFREKNKPKKKQSKKKSQESDKPDLANLIDDELKGFSRWDIAEPESMPSFSKKLQLPKAAISLEVIDGPEKGRVIQLTKGNVTLGRGKADIKLRDIDVSRRHASIETFSEKQIILRDLASTNGTFVNKKRVSYSKLSSGDEIQLGSTLLRFVIGEEE